MHVYYVRMWVIFQLILIINLIRKSMNERERRNETEQTDTIGEKSVNLAKAIATTQQVRGSAYMHK